MEENNPLVGAKKPRKPRAPRSASNYMVLMMSDSVDGQFTVIARAGTPKAAWRGAVDAGLPGEMQLVCLRGKPRKMASQTTFGFVKDVK